MLSNGLLNLWDPGARFRDGDQRMTILQGVSLPVICIGLMFTVPIDVCIVLYVFRNRHDD